MYSNVIFIVRVVWVLFEEEKEYEDINDDFGYVECIYVWDVVGEL